jgi:hypothetical protein
VGIDLAKRAMEVCILDGERIERHGLTTNEKGRNILASFLRKTDVAGYEVCRYGNRLARMLQKEWRIPAVSAEFVERMEDVLETYKLP